MRVECDIRRFDDVQAEPLTPVEVGEIWKRAFDLVRGTVNLCCFAMGCEATVILDKYTDKFGSEISYYISDPELAALCKAYSLDEAGSDAFDVIFSIVLSEPAFFMALEDLITANTLPHHAPVACARAIEGVRRMISASEPTAKAWEMMRQKLNIGEEYLKFITELSKGPRHADRTYIPGPSTAEIARRTWTIMNRFLEFRKRSNLPLPETEFPKLQ